MGSGWIIAALLAVAQAAKPGPAEVTAFSLSALEMRADDSGVRIQLQARDWCELTRMDGRDVFARYGDWCSEPYPLVHEGLQRSVQATYAVGDLRKPLEFEGLAGRERMDVKVEDLGVATRRTWEPDGKGWWFLENIEIGRLLVLHELRGEPTDKLRWKLSVTPRTAAGKPIPAVWGEPDSAFMVAFSKGVKEAPPREQPDGSMPLQQTPRALFVTVPAGTLAAHGPEWVCEALRGDDLDMLFSSEASLETIGEYVLQMQDRCPSGSVSHLFHALRYQVGLRWDQALEAADLDESRRLLREFSGLMESGWVVEAETKWVELAKQVLPKRIEAAQQAHDVARATVILDELGWTLDEDFVKQARLETYRISLDFPVEVRRAATAWEEQERAQAMERVNACQIWYPRTDERGSCEAYCAWKAGGSEREGMELGYNLCVSECQSCF